MSQNDAPQLYLIGPARITAAELAQVLTPVLDVHPVACLRLPGAGDPTELARIADLARELAHARDIPVVIEDHVAFARAHGLDGVHLTQGARAVRFARKELGNDAIVGAFCGNSRHDGMNAGEAGADYVSFGAVAPSPDGAAQVADPDLLQWWAETIEVPLVVEGALDAAAIRALWPIADFIAIGPEIWSAADPSAALAALWPA